MKSNLLILILTSLFLSSCFTPGSQNTDENLIVFTGGTILTVDENFSEVEAIAVRDNQIIVTGSLSRIESELGDSYKVIDLEGKTMLPGFIDAHTHVLNGALLYSISEYVGMERFRRTEDVIEYLKEYNETLEPGEWLIANAWDPSIMEGPSELTKDDLDEISTERPVFILNASGHLAYANSAAFEAAGIDDTVVNPDGAEFSRDENGSINGVMKNNLAYLMVLYANPVLAEVDLEEAVINLLDDFSSNGITMATEQLLGPVTSGRNDFDILLKAAERSDFKVRIRAYPGYTHEEVWEVDPIAVGEGNDLVRAVGYKLVADGSNQGYTGLQRENYLHSHSHGNEYQSLEEMADLIYEKSMEGWQVSIHGNGDKAIDNILDALEIAKDRGADFSKLRPRIEHSSILHDDHIMRMKEFNVSSSFLIGHVHYWGVDFRDNIFGEDKAMLLDRCKSVEDAGLSYTLHSDYPVSNADPLQMIFTAVTRETWKEPDYILAPDERVSVESAIRAMTIEAAWQLMSDDISGSIEVGKKADFVILDKDPRIVEPGEIRDIEVLETWMDGRKVYSAE